MSEKQDIKNAIQSMTTPNHNGYGVLCTVDSVNGDFCYCVPINGDADIQNVKIVPDSLTKYREVPKVGSIVVVAFMSDSSAYIALIGAIDSFNLNGTNFNGLVKIGDLVTKLNNLENAYNDLVTKFNAHTHILTLTVGTGTAAITVTPETTVLVPTTQPDLENTTVLHGDGT